MLYRLFSLLLMLSLLLCGCTDTPDQDQGKTDGTQKSTAVSFNGLTYPLGESTDMGQAYIDSFVFLGESTTYHLKNRGVLTDGTDTTQVWGPKSGTLMLDASTSVCRIVYPETQEEIDLSEAMKRRCPKYILLTFGLNGASVNISRGEAYYKACYSELISTLLKGSPNTTVILGSCFPVASNMDMSAYTVDVSTLNDYIDTINQWTCSLARELGLAYLNTAEGLKDESGTLYDKYQVGDGYHLTREAYIEILKYIRTHAHPKEILK